MGILGELWVKLGLRSEEFNKGLDKAKKDSNDFSETIGKVGARIAAAFSIQQVIAFSHEVTELANKAAGVKKAFDNLNSPNLLRDLRAATKGTVDDLQLMQRAVQAKNFNIPVENLATYLKFATQRAWETGQSVDYLVDSIVTGLGRQSILILDNLGISAAELRDNMKDGSSMADAVGKIIEKSFANAPTIIDETALATGRLAAAWTNFKIALGEEKELQGTWAWLKTTAANFLNVTRSFMDAGMSLKNSVQIALGAAIADPIKGDYSGLVDSINNADITGATTGEGKGKGKEVVEEEEKEKVKGLINLLNEEIKKKEEIRNLSENEEEIHRLNTEIAALKEKLEVLQMTEMEYAKVAELWSGEIPQMDSIIDTDALKANVEQGKEIIDQAREVMMQQGALLSEQALAQQEQVNEAITTLNSALAAGISASVNELANLIAGVESASIGSVIKALLTPLADACITIGTLVMASGTAIEALRSSLMEFFGVGAVAAGAILIGIGTAAKAGLAAIGRNGGKSSSSVSTVTNFSGGNIGGVGMGFSNWEQQTQSLNLTGVLKGQDIVLAVEKTNQNNRR